MEKILLENMFAEEKRFIESTRELTKQEKNLKCVDGRIIGTGRADYTRGATSYDLVVEGKKFSLIDIPGIEGDESKFEAIIKEALERAHVIFYVNGSGKKIEQATLEKIKKYMHDGTSVYAIFNVHCKAKKERIEGIDKSYSDELELVYKQQKEIVVQTEKELKDFLGKNFKESLLMNGLLAFSAVAFDDTGSSSVIIDVDKNLRNDQLKYLLEYSDDVIRMKSECGINHVIDVINDKVKNFEKTIYEENIKKLKNRLQEMIRKIEELRGEEVKKIKGFISVYNDFQTDCRNAKDDFIQRINHVGYYSVADAFANVRDDLFNMIESDGGKTRTEDIQDYFDCHKNDIIKNIQNGVNRKIQEAQKDYDEAIGEAEKRLINDLNREKNKFEVQLEGINISLNASFGDALKYSLGDLGGLVARTAGLAMSGAALGSVIPGIGTLIGGIAGAILGILSSIWNFFASEATRINRAKEKLQRNLEEQIDIVSEGLSKELKKMNYEDEINKGYEQIYEKAELQKVALKNAEKLLDDVIFDLKLNYKKIM